MVIGSALQLSIGARARGITDDRGHRVELPFLVLRVATFEEYLADLDDEARTLALQSDFGGDYFYEVSVD